MCTNIGHTRGARRSGSAAVSAVVVGATLVALSGPAAAQPGATTPSDTPPSDTPAAPVGADATPPAPGAPGGAARIAPQRPLTPEEMAVLSEVEEDYKVYRDAAEGHYRRMRALLLREFNQRTSDLEKRYAERIRKTEDEKRRRHLEAIALLEKFIAEHPDHKEFTPDAMFRLADLYLDEAEYELEQLEEQGDPELVPLADYSKSLALWEQILARFPDYRQLAGTLYLLAYYGKTKDERKSLKLFLALTCANKHKYTDPAPPEPNESEARAMLEGRTLRTPYADCVPMRGAEPALIQHAWVRGIGDHHFLVPGELDEAIGAYSKIIADKGADLYAEALYKLSWSYYRRDFLIEAIRGFDESVVLYDKTVAAGETPKLELREEALQYIAVSFTDPWQWEGELETNPDKALQRAQDFYQGRTDEPHVRDVWEVLGRAFLDIQAYDQAIISFRTAIGEPWHLHPNNPVVHQEIVNAYEAKGDKLAANEAAAELATRYAPGSPWYLANEKNREAMENQRRIGERMLYAAARNMHVSATRAREDYIAEGSSEPAAKAAYLQLYDRAVQLYQSFLQQYPESEHVYEFTFGMAEALFFSEKYLESIEHYRWVRDHRELSSTNFEAAARSIIQAYEAEVARLVAAGQLDPLQIPDAEAIKAMPKPIQPRSIPPLYIELQKAWDEYQQLVNDPKTAPLMGMNAALVSVSFLRLEDAIRRFQIVLDKFCGSPEAVKAKDGLLSVYDGLGQDDKFKETNDNFINKQCGDAKSIELAKSQNRSIEFRKATDLFAAGQYPEAAEAFYVYYKTAPDDDADLPIALYNAAIAYREADKPKTAIYLLKEFADNKSPQFRKSAYYLAALRLMGVAYQGVFDYDKAVDTYLELYKQAKTAKARGLTPPPPPPGEQQQSFEQVKLDALFNAAVLRELDRDFKAAIKLYRQYEREESDVDAKDKALLAVARIYRSSGDVRNLADTYALWRRKYGSRDGNEDNYVFSFYDTAKAYAKRGRTRDADKYRNDTIDAWRKKGAQPNTQGARWAGEYALLFAERQFAKSFLPHKIKTAARTEKDAKRQVKALQDFTKKMQDQYTALNEFGVLEYTMASNVRYGQTLTLYAQKFFEMPTPKYIIALNNKRPELDLLAQYEAQLAAKLAPLAGEAKTYWLKVVEAGKSKKISNKWTALALENLNQEFPDEFPILHRELAEGTDNP